MITAPTHEDHSLAMRITAYLCLGPRHPALDTLAEMVAEHTRSAVCRTACVTDPAILAQIEYRRGNGVPVTSLTWEEYAHELEDLVRDHEEVHVDKHRLVREIDVIINGEEGAAKQASLCDVVAQIREMAEEVSEIAQLARDLKTEATALRADRDNALAALGIHPDTDYSLADEIARLRDENREWFHVATRRMLENDELKRINLEMARLAEEQRGIPRQPV